MTDHRSKSIDELLTNPDLDANISPFAVKDRIEHLSSALPASGRAQNR